MLSAPEGASVRLNKVYMEKLVVSQSQIRDSYFLYSRMALTDHNRLSQLPAELLVMIFRQCADFTPLWSLIQTSRWISSVFDSAACDFVSAIMAETVPVQTRIPMQAVLCMRTGRLQCTSYADAYDFATADIRPADRVTATVSQLRRFIYLCHRIHVLSHLCIDGALQRCLRSPLGLQEYPQHFEIATRTEEQRMLFAFWRVFFYNELKIEASKGALQWSPKDLYRLKTGGMYHHFPSHVKALLAITALFFIRDASVGETDEPLPPEPFELPSIPSEQEYHWVCQPPPSPKALSQGKSFEEYERRLEAIFVSWTAIQKETLLQADATPHPEPSAEPEEVPVDARQLFYPPDSDDDSGDSDDDELFGSDEEVAGVSSGSEVEIVPRCGPYVPRPVQNYGPQSQPDWVDLDQESLGVQFWLSMAGNPIAGPAKYISSDAYIYYGFAIWEKHRMIQFGLWSDDAPDNMAEYYRRWYGFLSPEDIDRWKWEFRYMDDDDYE